MIALRIIATFLLSVSAANKASDAVLNREEGKAELTYNLLGVAWRVAVIVALWVI